MLFRSVAFLPRSVVLLGVPALAVCERHQASVAARVEVDGVGLGHCFELRNIELDGRDGAEVEVLRHEALHSILAYIVIGVDILQKILVGHTQGRHPECVCEREGTTM